MVFQGFNLFPHLSALDDLTLGPVFARGEDEAIVRKRPLAAPARLAVALPSH